MRHAAQCFERALQDVISDAAAHPRDERRNPRRVVETNDRVDRGERARSVSALEIAERSRQVVDRRGIPRRCGFGCLGLPGRLGVRGRLGLPGRSGRLRCCVLPEADEPDEDETKVEKSLTLPEHGAPSCVRGAGAASTRGLERGVRVLITMISSSGVDLRSLHRWWLPRRRFVVFLGLVGILGAGARFFFAGANEGNAEASVVAVLEREGLRGQPDAILWLDDDAGPWTARSGLILAHAERELNDVFYFEVRPGRGGAILDLLNVTNLTKSPAAEETDLARSGDCVGFLSRGGDRIEALTLLDVRGEPAEQLVEFSEVERIQHGITNLQQTGRWRGFGETRYQLVEPAAGSLSIEDDHFVVALYESESRIVIDPKARRQSSAILEGDDRVDQQVLVAGVPGGITWLVDTVRGFSFVGPEPIEWLENRVFSLQDYAERTKHAWFGSEKTEEVALAELGVTREEVTEHLTEERRAMLTESEAELGWPPRPMQPFIVDDPVAGEGEWIPVVDDPFVNEYPNAPPAFVQSFVRPDIERPYARVYVTMWDPRQVQLRAMPGTREPESSTGERGSGFIPRDDETIERLVGAFDGGFQAMHGEFGMMANGRIYLPPKPWAATVAVWDDGRVGMGSWPSPNWQGRYFDEELANRQIPSGVVEMRQNLTSLVENGVYNPWERWWWGAAPRETDDQTFTYRSGLCLTDEGFMAFFWGGSLGPESLGQSMIQARCKRAMHLDMNSGHCGLELFRPYRRSEEVSPLRRVHTDYEYDGELPGARDWRIRARKGVRSMAMRFPRYLAHDPRDFFYLTLRPILPGPNLTGLDRPLSSAGLPHAGWPYAFAKARIDDSVIVRIDPRRAVPGPLWELRPEAEAAAATTSLASSGVTPTAPSDASVDAGRRGSSDALSGDEPDATGAPAESERTLAVLTAVRGAPEVAAAEDEPAAGAHASAVPEVALYARRAVIGWHFAVGLPRDTDAVLLRGARWQVAALGTRQDDSERTDSAHGPADSHPDASESDPGGADHDPTDSRFDSGASDGGELRFDPIPAEVPAAIGVDRDGFLVYAEGEEFSNLLARAGVESALLLAPDVRLAFVTDEGGSAPDGVTPREIDERALPFVAETRPAADVMFPSTEPTPYREWGYLQGQRVRYFRTGTPRFLAPDAGTP